MTKLNQEQDKLLDTLAAAKSKADEKIADELAKFEAKKYALRAPVRKAAQAADRGGVPARQIGFVLGTSDHKTIKAYIAGD